MRCGRVADGGRGLRARTVARTRARTMRFIRRRKKDEDEALRCPICRERLPDEATVCRMCGERIPPYLVGRPDVRDEVEPPRAER